MKRLHQILYESYVLLLEYDRDKTIKTHGEKALDAALSRTHEHDSYLSDVHGLYHGNKGNSIPGSNRHKAMHELMSQLEEADPTPNKKYVQHIARMYGNDGFNRHEDVFSRGKDALAKFHDLATRKIIPAEHRDIGKVKTLSQLEDIVDAHSDKLSGKESSKEHHEAMKSQATITEHGSFTHIIPHTREASQHFGKGTRWCTAATNHNMHDHYSNDGPLQMYMPKEPKHVGEKYQFHYSTDQLMDEKDTPVKSTGHTDIDNHIAQYKRECDTAHQSTAGFDHQEAFVRRRTLNHNWDRATSEQVGKVIEKGTFGSYEEDHFEENRPGEFGKSPLDHPAMNSELLHKIVDHKNLDVVASALWSKHLDQGHIDKLVDRFDPKKPDYHNDHNPGEIRGEAFRKTKNPKHFEAALKTLDSWKPEDEDKDALEGMSRNKHLPHEVLDTLIRHHHQGTYAVGSSNATDEQLAWASKHHTNPAARSNANHHIRERAKRAAEEVKPKPGSGIIFHTK